MHERAIFEAMRQPVEASFYVRKWRQAWPSGIAHAQSAVCVSPVHI